MKITNIIIKESNLKLFEPFSYFTATLNYLPYVVINIESNDGLIGLGEASLAWDVTGETQEGAFGLLKYIKPLLINHSLNCIQDIKYIMDSIDINIHKNTGLKSGIEFALLDLLGKKKKKPVYELLDGKKRNM
jgi:L-alanine-DL-glutamate epimerase-like enolase superfamily enzyme